MCGRPEYPRPSGAEDEPRPPSPTVGPLTPSVDEDVRASPSFDYHQERRLQLKDEIWLSHHLPRLPPKTDEDGAHPGPKAGIPSSPGRSRTTPQELMIGVSQAFDPSPSAFHPAKQELELGNVQRGGRSMSMDGDEAGEEEEEDHRHAGSRDMMSPMSSMSPKDTMIHRTELDDQERLDLEEEARERELSGQGFGEGQTSGQPAAVPAALLHSPITHLMNDPNTFIAGILTPSTPLSARSGSSSSSHPSSTSPTTPISSSDVFGDQLLIQLQLLAFSEHGIGSELEELYSSFARCLDLRDKYLALSHQRLGDNPRDHDGTFTGFYPRTAADTMGLKPDAGPETCETPPSSASQDKSLPAWNIYPPPPPPHWHWKSAPDGPQVEFQKSRGGHGSGAATPVGAGRSDMNNFKFEDCEIPPVAKGAEFALNDEGVFEVFVDHDQLEIPDNDIPTSPGPNGLKGKQKIQHVPSLKEYFTDLDFLLGVCSDGPAKSFAFRRLKYLASKWSLYCLLNEYQELADMKAVPHRDFYNVRKVDTHIHHSASMNQKHLLRFIKYKLKKNPNEIVIHRDGKDLTLQQVFESLNLTAYDLSIDTLDMHAHQEFHRFDRFNDRYNPTGSSRLREIFLKTDNLLKGKYLAELTQELITDLEQSKYQQSEWRLSIYGRNLGEWDKLAKWVINHKLISHNVRWLIQVPRLYEVFKAGGLVNNFEDVVRNVFQPLFEVTKDPSSHPELHVFLQRVVGFDSVDDESKPERRLYRKFPTARMWDTKQSPPYSYWIYYMYANMASLNGFRRSRGFNTFVLRPHCGEAGDPDHLSSAFLTSHSIAHGILLRKVPALQYLFYLKQVGLAMSPLSNNALFLTYERNPFKDFFRTGLNVSLSTDDPLQFHFTASHLLEEYSCAAQIYKLTPADMCELARNSVLQSGWEMQVKKHWLGHSWYLPGSAGNDIHKTNVPTIRLAYRHATLLEELSLIQHGTKPVSSTRPQTHMKTPIPGPSRSPSAPARPLAQGPKNPSRPGMPTHSSDVAAAAMAMGNVTAGVGRMNVGADAVNRVGAGMQPEFLVGGLGEMDERQRKRSGSHGANGGKLEMSHEIRR